MKKITILLLASFFLTSCEPDEIGIIKEVEKQYTWQSHPVFQHGNAIQLNSLGTENNFFSLGPTSFTSVLPEGETDRFGNNVSSQGLLEELSLKHKFPIAANYFISYTEKDPSKLTIRPNKNPVTYTSGRPAALSISLPAIDKEFARFHFLGQGWGEALAVNSKNQALAVYATNNHSNSFRALLLDVTTYSDNALVFADTVKAKIIRFPGPLEVLISLKAIGENFYVSQNYSETYRVTPDGNQVKVLDNSFTDIFEHNQVLYGFTYDGKGYISSNDGLTWQEKFEIPIILGDFNYTKIDGKVIGYYQSQIFEFFPSRTQISMKELDNYGLVGKSITSITAFEGKAYISTLSGVYYKDLKNLWVERKREEAPAP